MAVPDAPEALEGKYITTLAAALYRTGARGDARDFLLAHVDRLTPGPRASAALQLLRDPRFITSEQAILGEVRHAGSKLPLGLGVDLVRRLRTLRGLEGGARIDQAAHDLAPDLVAPAPPGEVLSVEIDGPNYAPVDIGGVHPAIERARTPTRQQFSRRMHAITDATLVKSGFAVAVWTEDGLRADLVNACGLLHALAHGAPSAENIDHAEHNVLCALDSTPGINYCHWTLDSLVRLSLLQSTFRPDAASAVAVGGDAAYIAPSIELVAPAASTLVVDGAVRCRTLLISESSIGVNHPAEHGSPVALEQLRSLLRPPGAPDRGTRKIYISRHDAPTRRLMNEERVSNFLAKRGFETIRPGEHSFEEQRAIFSDAKVIVGVHGAGLTNIIFAPKRSRIVELLPHAYGTASYALVAAGVGQRYAAVRAPAPQNPPPVPARANFQVPVPLVRRGLDALRPRRGKSGARSPGKRRRPRNRAD